MDSSEFWYVLAGEESFGERKESDDGLWFLFPDKSSRARVKIEREENDRGRKQEQGVGCDFH